MGGDHPAHVIELWVNYKWANSRDPSSKFSLAYACKSPTMLSYWFLNQNPNKIIKKNMILA